MMDDEEEVRSKIAKYMKLLLDDDKIEHALRRLAKLPMNLERLSETGVGKAVNQLRNHEEFGEKAQELVAMWKDVARNGGVREHHRVKQESPEQEAPSQPSRRRSRDDHKEPPKKKLKKEREHHKTVAPKGLSFEDVLAKSDAVKHTKPKKPRAEELDWAKHSGNLDPNYRPKPRVLNYEPVVPTVLSDDDRAAPGGSKGKAAALDVNLFTAKKDTMRVYAGRKRTANLTKVPTLFEMCIPIEDTGDIPFDILKPVLERCSPSQLYYVEQRNPYLIEDSDCLWEKHCQKDFRDCRSHDDETWRECYQRMVHERDDKLKKLSTRIVQHHKEVVSPVRTAKLADAKAPRDVRKRQVKNGTAIIGRELPGALEVSAARREIFDKGSSDSLRQLPGAVRNLNSTLGAHSDKKKSATKKGALMVKTLKMLKGRRR